MELYRTYNSYLKEKYGEKVWRLPLDQGYPCPNRIDGNKGCTFCDGVSFLPEYLDKNDDLSTQLEKGRMFCSNRLGVKSFIGYFQANTNTYGDKNKLLDNFRYVLSQDFIVGISISTRPDWIQTDLIQEIAGLSALYNKEVWIELGLQSVYDDTLKRINRGHSYAQFLEAVTKIRSVSSTIKICPHMIIGLPSEDGTRIIEGFKKLLCDVKIDAVKIRPLDLEPGTEIYEDYMANPDDFKRWTDVEFVHLICDIITLLPEDVIVMRFANFKTLALSVTDEASYTKGTILRMVDRELERRRSVKASESSLKSTVE